MLPPRLEGVSTLGPGAGRDGLKTGGAVATGLMDAEASGVEDLLALVKCDDLVRRHVGADRRPGDERRELGEDSALVAVQRGVQT